MSQTIVRLMANYDPAWESRWAEADRRSQELMATPGALSDAEKTALAECHRAMQQARESRFRTTAEYRDHSFAYCRALLEREGIHMPLPALPEDCAKEDVDRAIDRVWRAVEVTNSENF
jgi:2-methylcitrate dehydratase PrpD